MRNQVEQFSKAALGKGRKDLRLTVRREVGVAVDREHVVDFPLGLGSVLVFLQCHAVRRLVVRLFVRNLVVVLFHLD